jgi:hypothetical protein
MTEFLLERITTALCHLLNDTSPDVEQAIAVLESALKRARTADRENARE